MKIKLRLPGGGGFNNGTPSSVSGTECMLKIRTVTSNEDPPRTIILPPRPHSPKRIRKRLDFPEISNLAHTHTYTKFLRNKTYPAAYRKSRCAFVKYAKTMHFLARMITFVVEFKKKKARICAKRNGKETGTSFCKRTRSLALKLEVTLRRKFPSGLHESSPLHVTGDVRYGRQI